MSIFDAVNDFDILSQILSKFNAPQARFWHHKCIPPVYKHVPLLLAKDKPVELRWKKPSKNGKAMVTHLMLKEIGLKIPSLYEMLGNLNAITPQKCLLLKSHCMSHGEAF